MRFKPGVEVYNFNGPWYVMDWYELRDGTLYLSVEPPLKPPTTAGDLPQEFGTLSRGVFSRIEVIGSPMAIGMIGTLNGYPVLQTIPPLRRYSVVGSRLMQISATKEIVPLDASDPIGTDFRLHDGSKCFRPGGGNSVYAIRADGNERLLISASEIEAAMHTTLGNAAIFCATFDGDDYLDVDDDILIVHSGKAKVVAGGRIYGSGPHHLLIQADEPAESAPYHPAPYLEAIQP